MGERNRAGTTLSLRLVACGYLVYLAWTLVRDLLKGVSTLPPALGWISAVVFAGAGLGFGVYAWRGYRRQIQAAEGAEKAEDPPAEEARESDSTDDPV